MPKLDDSTIILISVILVLIPAIIVIIKIYFYINFFKISKNIKELNIKNDEIIKLLNKNNMH